MSMRVIVIEEQRLHDLMTMVCDLFNYDTTFEMNNAKCCKWLE